MSTGGELVMRLGVMGNYVNGRTSGASPSGIDNLNLSMSSSYAARLSAGHTMSLIILEDQLPC